MLRWYLQFSKSLRISPLKPTNTEFIAKLTKKWKTKICIVCSETLFLFERYHILKTLNQGVPSSVFSKPVFTFQPILHPNLFYIQIYFTSKPILHPNLFYIQIYFTSKPILHPNLLYIETSFYTQTSFTCKPVLHTQWIYIQVMIVCKMLLFNRGLENPESLILRRRQFM